MYEAIVFLPLLGAIIAGVIALVGARNRLPGADPPPPDAEHAVLHAAESHAVAQASHHEEESVEPAAGSQAAALITSTLLVIACVLSWYAFYDVGIAGHDARVRMFSFITFGDLKSDWALRVDSISIDHLAGRVLR